MTLSNPAQYISGRTVQEQMNSLIDYVDQRAADVALDAIASDVAQVHQDMLDADADAAAAAASAAAAAGTLANAVKKTGEASQSIAGDVAVAGKVTSGATPSGNTDLTTKKYVDDADALMVHLAGNETITGVKEVPLETTGTFSDQAASSNKVKNELDNYAPMVRTSGNQTISGSKTFNNSPVFMARVLKQSAASGDQGYVLTSSTDDATVAPTTTYLYPNIVWRDKNDTYMGALLFQHRNDGKTEVYIRIRNQDGTFKSISLGVSD